MAMYSKFNNHFLEKLRNIVEWTREILAHLAPISAISAEKEVTGKMNASPVEAKIETTCIKEVVEIETMDIMIDIEMTEGIEDHLTDTDMSADILTEEDLLQLTEVIVEARVLKELVVVEAAQDQETDMAVELPLITEIEATMVEVATET